MGDCKTVYICSGRGSGKVETQCRLYKKLIDSGYRLEFIKSTPFSKLRGRRFEPAIIDKDILHPDKLAKAEQMLNKILKGEINHG